jgi:hypothetical protein
MRASFRLSVVTRHGNGQGRAKGNIHAELDEHLRQCIPEPQALLFITDPFPDLTSQFVVSVQVVDI